MEQPALHLVEDPEHFYGASATGDVALDNRLIHGDNLPALKLLEHEFAGRVQCIYIDPPYNTGQVLDHYNDHAKHADWQASMRQRLILLHRLLTEGGTLFVHIDDNELGYLIVLLDEIFGRKNRASIVTFKQGAAKGHKAINPGCVTTTNFILIYTRDRDRWSPSRVFVARDRDTRYSQFIKHRDGVPSKWEVVPLLRAFAEDLGVDQREVRSRLRKSPGLLDAFVLGHLDAVAQLCQPDYRAVSQAARRMIDLSKAQPETIFHLPREQHADFYFIRGKRLVFYAMKVKNVDGVLVAGEPLSTLWNDLPSHNLHKEGGVSFPKGKKPEALVRRVIELSTRAGDWVLDCFGGSGTTGAVAHKMGRRWIMIEQGEHCLTHIVPRLHAVVDGTDQGGISKAVAWQGGGGFRFFNLTSSAQPNEARPAVVQQPAIVAPAYSGGVDLDQYLEDHPDLFSEEPERPRRGRRTGA